MEERTIVLLYYGTVVMILELAAMAVGINGKAFATSLGSLCFILGLAFQPKEMKEIVLAFIEKVLKRDAKAEG